MIKQLTVFAQEIYAIKLDRNAFAGQRRAYAISLLKQLSKFFEVPEFLEMCMISIKSKSKSEFIECVDSLLEHYEATDDEIPEDLIKIIENRINKTNSRIEVVSGLLFLLKTGVIGETEASKKLKSWNKKN